MSRSISRLSMIALSVLVLALGACAADPAAEAPAAEVGEAHPDHQTAAPELTADAAAETASYAFAENSTIGFVGSKVTGSHEGGFRSFDGSMTVAGDDPSTARVEVVIHTDSLWSDNERLTGHLKSADFFDVEQFPTATFRSTGVAANADGTYTVTGDLELHGVTKSISFPAAIVKSEAGGYAATAEFSVKRFDFGIEYPGKADDLIRDDVLIKLDLQTEA